MPFVEASNQLPPCSHCGGSLVISAVMPQTDAAGLPIRLELCPVCDAGRSPAGALLDWFAVGGGLDASRAAEGGHLLMEWTKDRMAQHGWDWVEVPDDASALTDRGPEQAVHPLAVDPAAGSGSAQVARLQSERDGLRERLVTAGPDERDDLKASIRRLGEALANTLITHDTDAQALRAEAPQGPPGPLSPEAEQRVLDLYQRLIAEQNELDSDSGED